MEIDIIGSAGQSAQQIDVLIGSLRGLDNAIGVNLGNLSKLSSGFRSLSKAVGLVNAIDFDGLNAKMSTLNLNTNLASDTEGFVTGAKQFRSAVNTMDKSAEKFPTMMEKINKLDLTEFKLKLQEISLAVIPFNQTMGNMSQIVAKFPKASSGARVANAKSAQFFGLGTGIMKLATSTFFARRLGGYITEAVHKSNIFVENMHLFSVALGENTTKAMEFVRALEGLGLDPAESSRMMGVFYQVSNALGLSSQKAYTLSEQFTKLTYDLASFFNIDTASAFDKMKAGLVGETEPLRALGLVITENNLAETARRLGITKSIRTMVEQEKIQLRFITLMQQSKNVLNDMEATLNNPANALRVLKAQFNVLSREIGNIFIPVLTRALPYLIAFVQVLGEVAKRLAQMAGYKIPEFDKAVGGSMSISDNIDDATKGVGKLKKSLAGFDEVNLINQDGGLANGGLNSSGLLDLDLEQYGYETLIGNIDSKVEELLPQMRELAETLGKVALALVTIKGIGYVWAGLQGLGVIISGLATGIGKFVLGFEGIKGTTGIMTSLGGAVKGLIGFFGGLSTPVLIAVGALLAIAGAFVYMYKTSDEFKKKVDDVLKWFADFTKGTFDYLKEQLGGVWDALKEFWDTLYSLIIKPVGDTIIKFLAEMGFDIFKNLTEVIAIITNTINMVLGGFLQALKGIIQMITGLLQGFLTGDWSKLWEGLGNVVQGVAVAISGILIGILNGLIKMVNEAIRLINTIKVPDWIPLVGGKSLSIREISYITSPDFGTNNFPTGTGNYVNMPPIQTVVNLNGKEIATAVHDYDSSAYNRGVSYSNW